MEEKFFAFGAHGNATVSANGYSARALLPSWTPGRTAPGVNFGLTATFSGTAAIVPRGASSGVVDVTGKTVNLTAFLATVTTVGRLGDATADDDNIFELTLSDVAQVVFPGNAAEFDADGYFVFPASRFLQTKGDVWVRFERGRLWPNWSGVWWFKATSAVDFTRVPVGGVEFSFAYSRPFLGGVAPVISEGAAIVTRCFSVQQIGLG